MSEKMALRGNDNWKHYGNVDEIITNEGSNVADLSVVAVVDPSENYPEARIIVGSSGQFGRTGVEGFAISVKKWRELERLVNRACVDITAACPAHGDPVFELSPQGKTRPELLRAYLERQYRELNTTATSSAVPLDTQLVAAEESKLVLSLLRWMDEAGIAKQS